MSPEPGGPPQLQKDGILGAVQHSTPRVSPRYCHGAWNQRTGVRPISVTENFAAQSPRHTFLSVILPATQSWAHLDLNPGFRIIQFKLSYAQYPTTPTPYGPPTPNKCFLLMLHARGWTAGVLLRVCSILRPGGKQDLWEMETPWPRRRGCDGATP